MSTNGHKDDWFDDYDESGNGLGIEGYDITATPNDFNVMTLCSFVESGAVRIPGFQRNFVWDMGRASRLIESLILGLPVPQLFLYEQARNDLLVIDGQQRLMSIYYFTKKRFPRKERRSEIRHAFHSFGALPADLLEDDEFFEPFTLRLSERLPERTNKLSGLDYDTLGDQRSRLDLRPIRNIVVKQNGPSDDDSSMFEVFNRLNTGGVNLRPQEIRASMYHSEFYTMLYRINSEAEGWRRFLTSPTPDLHMKDVEILLRSFAMLIDGDEYKPSMVRFLNQFSKKSTLNKADQNAYLEALFRSFLDTCANLPDDAFLNKVNRRFNIALYEATFASTLRNAFARRVHATGLLVPAKLQELASDPAFTAASQKGTTQRANVQKRIARADAIVGSTMEAGG